jgi:rhodanese-related sulfurtransferase
MKKIIALILVSLFLVGCAKSDAQLTKEGYVLKPLENGYVAQAALPAPRDTTKTYKPTQDAAETACTADVYNAACSSIGVANLDQYLNRDDVVYIDVRDYKDYAMKHFKNFEVIPYFAFIFNANAHTDPTMVQLYGGTPAAPVAVYAESDAILNAMFPKDKTLFIMCQSGGRVVQLMNILKAKGYDMSKIYNIGGVGQYTDAKYADYITDTGELTIEGAYKINDVVRNAN